MKSYSNIYVGKEQIAKSKEKLKAERGIKPPKPRKKKSQKKTSS